MNSTDILGNKTYYITKMVKNAGLGTDWWWKKYI
jgi:hypothetical protein